MGPLMNDSRAKEYARSYNDEKYIIASFYKFVPIRNLDELQNTLYHICRNLGISGTILLATQGFSRMLDQITETAAICLGK